MLVRLRQVWVEEAYTQTLYAHSICTPYALCTQVWVEEAGVDDWEWEEDAQEVAKEPMFLVIDPHGTGEWWRPLRAVRPNWVWWCAPPPPPHACPRVSQAAAPRVQTATPCFQAPAPCVQGYNPCAQVCGRGLVHRRRGALAESLRGDAGRGHGNGNGRDVGCGGSGGGR